MPEHYRVAAIQFEPTLGAKGENTARLLELVEQAAEDGARLIVLPEMATTGYCWHDRDEIRPHVETIPGSTTAALGETARRHGCYVVAGMPELDATSGIFYNSAALIGPDGVVGVYRKTHSFVSDNRWAKDGDLGLPVWDTPLGRIGILICMDAGYFEPARLLALAGADVLCFPTNWLGERSPGPAWIARAWENGCYLIAANRYGLERGVQFSGGSCVLSPDGSIQAQLDSGDGIVYGEVAPAASRRTAMLAARRPELYDNLTLNAYLWEPDNYHGLYGHSPLPAGCCSQLAVAQLTPQPGDAAANLRQIEQALAACGAGALVVLPEYALTGRPAAGQTGMALTADAAAVWHERLVELARRGGAWLVAGYTERDDDRIFSAAALLGPQGVLAHYRKTHIAGDEAAWCSPGSSRPPVVDLPLGRVGLLLDSDLCAPELARSLAIAGCDVLAVPAGAAPPPALGLPGAAYHFHLARQRAHENGCYLAYAALPVPLGTGNSAVFAPDSGDRDDEVILDAAATGVVVRSIDTRGPVRAKQLVGRRRTDLYDALQREGRNQV